jgi:hypothetical protein
MKYLITSIKEIEDILTPSLVEYDDDLPFNSFAFSKFEKQFRSCMRLYRIETFGEDYEKFPISFEEFNPRYDKFNGLNYDRLNEIIEIEEFKIELKQLLSRHEDYFKEDITDQLPNPSEAEFKLFFFNTLKSLEISYNFLLSTEIKNNVILNLVKDELIESYERAFEKAKITFPFYDVVFNKFKFEKNLSDTILIDKVKWIPTLSREEILKKLFDASNNRITFESFEKKLIEKKFISKELDQWKNSALSFMLFYTYCEREKLFRSIYFKNSNGVKLLRQLYSFEDGESLNPPSKRKLNKSTQINSEYFFLK